jgi:hypothetical protein
MERVLRPTLTLHSSSSSSLPLSSVPELTYVSSTSPSVLPHPFVFMQDPSIESDTLDLVSEDSIPTQHTPVAPPPSRSQLKVEEHHLTASYAVFETLKQKLGWFETEWNRMGGNTANEEIYTTIASVLRCLEDFKGADIRGENGLLFVDKRCFVHLTEELMQLEKIVLRVLQTVRIVSSRVCVYTKITSLSIFNSPLSHFSFLISFFFHFILSHFFPFSLSVSLTSLLTPHHIPAYLLLTDRTIRPSLQPHRHNQHPNGDCCSSYTCNGRISHIHTETYFHNLQ